MAKVIMVQGTMSNAGKSLLAAGLCRIFKQDGYKVAPFKSQNMALNSFITEEGLEMGRAQVMQAEAAGIKPSVYMNPILLKPTNDVGSQVIVNGEVLGNMKARDYFAYKKKLVPDILKAFHRLEEEYDIIVIEGAGSPAEINLKQDDIVNMGMARMAKAPVLLVGDIDRGGVFAQLIGTVMLLTEEERSMVKGLIINKFRGDKTILDPGIDMLEEKAGIPVVGVAPYLHIQVEDEDSLTERFDKKTEIGAIDIAVIRLPRISNFTDFNPFESIEGVSLRYVESVPQLKDPDMIILPGTKSTMDDLKYLRQSGLEAAILKQAASGKVIFGICGGYQMMGKYLSDPEGVEGGGEMRGMGLLPMKTVFAGAKTRTRVTGNFQKVKGILEGLSGEALEGYEIHMGQTTLEKGCLPLTELENYAADRSRTEAENPGIGKCKPDGAYRENIYGTYVHGVFDRENVAKSVVMALGKAKGLDMSDIMAFDFAAFKESQYDILASELRKNLDMKKIYEILEEGIRE
ncbi:MAG: cobyric acid synthase [Eubacteriales bacterium]|nr:cobyric acid synthase [Eubacteriales bacterium]